MSAITSLAILMWIQSDEARGKRINTTKSYSSVTQEFGTLSGIQVLDALRSEAFFVNDAKKKGTDVALTHWSKLAVKGAFWPHSDTFWEGIVLERGQWLIEKMLAHLAAQP